MKKTRRRGKTFYRYLFSYALILLLPTLLLTGLVSKYFLSDYRGELTAANRESAGRVKTIVDMQLKAMFGLLSQLEYSEWSRPQNITESDYSKAQFNRRLSQMVSNKRFCRADSLLSARLQTDFHHGGHVRSGRLYPVRLDA